MRALLAAALVLVLPLSAGAAGGTSGAQFLKLGAGARAGAMGDAAVADPADAFAVYYNPAGLTRVDRAQLGGAHNALFQGLSYQALSFANPLGGRKHAFGVGVFYLGVSGIQRRTGDSTDSIGSFEASDAAYVGSYAYAPSKKLSLGVSGKYISQSIDNYRGSSFAADVGLHYVPNPKSQRPMAVALVIRNAGQSVGYTASQKDPLPSSAHAGASFKPWKGVSLNLEGGKYRDAQAHGAFGAEFKRSLGENSAAALRAGYTTARSGNEGFNGVSAGAGLSFHRAAFDFAWIPFGTLGDAFRFSLLIKF